MALIQTLSLARAKVALKFEQVCEPSESGDVDG